VRTRRLAAAALLAVLAGCGAMPQFDGQRDFESWVHALGLSALPPVEAAARLRSKGFSCDESETRSWCSRTISGLPCAQRLRVELGPVLGHPTESIVVPSCTDVCL
jgi:hypothetical protein